MKKARSSKAANRAKKPDATDEASGHLERINALLKWWGAPLIDFSSNEAQLRCLREFTDGVQALYRGVSDRQRGILYKANQDIGAAAAGLAWPRKPNVVLGIQSDMAAKLPDGMSRQAHLLTDVAEGYVDRYATYAKRMAEICHRGKDHLHQLL